MVREMGCASLFDNQEQVDRWNKLLVRSYRVRKAMIGKKTYFYNRNPVYVTKVRDAIRMLQHPVFCLNNLKTDLTVPAMVRVIPVLLESGEVIIHHKSARRTYYKKVSL